MASWNGYLRLSLVTCAVRLYPATTETKKIRFHLINPETGNRISMRAHDAETGEELDRASLVKGYEYDRKRYVTLTNEELDQIKLESTKTIEIERFVDARKINVNYFDAPYFIVPDGKVAAEAYHVIRAAMEEEKVAGIGRVVLSSREHPLIVQPRDGGLTMTTLRSKDELRDPAEYFDEIPDVAVDKRMVEMAKSIIEKMKGDFDPDFFKDRYQEALHELVQAKVKGLPVKEQPEPEPTNVINLFDALKRSLGESPRKAPAGSRKPAPSAKTAKARGKKARRKAG
ncbi:MAG TPA: Ku protein [Alphaproteobacteria bacterium]|nr:Ku protein [Alphaproteobacteria bacterium]